MHEITVRPGQGPLGWVVEHKEAQPMRFLSAMAAENAARSLVHRLADAGQPARATVILRDGSLAGRVTRF